jgi:hypothetical protein
MAFVQTKQGGRVPLKAASGMGQWVPVQFLAGGSALSETVIAAATWNAFQFGLSAATVASPGDPLELFQQGDVGKGIAGASLGAGAFVGIGSTNGILAPLAAIAAGPTQPPRFAVGIALSNAAPGDVFSVYIDPTQVV